jgi:protease-4
MRSGLRWLFGLLTAWSLTACDAQPRRAEDTSGEPLSLLGAFPAASGQVLEIDLTAGAPEVMDGGLLPLPAARTYLGLVRALEDAARDERATAVVVRFGASGFGWARSEELARLLGAIRAAGKPVVCHTHGLDNASTWLLTAGCDRLWLSPAGGVDLVGIAAQVLYFRSALDRLSLRADFIAVGEYKSAVESFTRDGPSEPARRDLTETLASLRQSWLAGLAAARPRAKGASIAEGGPYSPEEALRVGLIDGIGYEQDALEDAKTRGHATTVKPQFGPERGAAAIDIAELVRVLSGVDDRAGGRPRIAVLPAVGSIAMSSSGGLFEGGGIAERAMTKTLRRLARDDGVKAVVLRIDSPGGSALASDLLWKEVSALREKKPVVVSVGDMAASGGYYIACAASRIVAEQTSIVGSIGVFGGKVTFDEGLATVGVNTVTFPASPEPGAAARAAYLSPLASWDEATRGRVRTQMQSVYDLFVRRVADGRRLPVDRVRQLAAGRIYSGVQAQQRGLVDELGGLARALAVARDVASLSADVPVVVEGTGDSLLELLGLGEGADRAQIETALARLQTRSAELRRALPPTLHRFGAVLTPLLDGEHVLAAAPYLVVIE